MKQYNILLTLLMMGALGFSNAHAVGFGSADADANATSVAGAVSGSSAKAYQSLQSNNRVSGKQQQQQSNSAVGSGNSTSTDVVVEGDQQEKRLPVNSAAPTIATGEGSGISFQTPSFGGSFSRSSDVHNHLMVAKAFYEMGFKDEAINHVKKAADVANYKGAFGKFWTSITLGLF